MKNKKSILLTTLFISTSVFAQSKYNNTGLTPDQINRYTEIDKKNQELLEYRPEKYNVDKTISGTRINPRTGEVIIVAPAGQSSTNTSNTLNTTTFTPNINHQLNNSRASIYSAYNQRRVSDLANSWSGKGARIVHWDYSKDYAINNIGLFNKETNLNNAKSLEDALSLLFRHIGLIEINNTRHIPPKACFESNDTIRIVDFNDECLD